MNSPSPGPQKDALTTEDSATAIFTSFAKVYTMNPNNKTFWLPSSTAAVPVSFYFDKHRSVYRIISYDKKDLVVNSTIFPSMSFIKTSATFGLWSDTKLRTIYGLGFSSNEHLAQFAEWFETVVRAAKKLEENLPLPPPAPSAVSIECECEDSSNTSSVATINPHAIGPPEPDRNNNNNHNHNHHHNNNNNHNSNQSHSHGPMPHKQQGNNSSGHCLLAPSNIWFDNDGGQSESYVPPKALPSNQGHHVHVVDSSSFDPSSNRGDGDYEVQHLTTSPMAKLAMENLQYQREVLKVKQLEVEMHSMRTTINTMHEALQKKSSECEKYRIEALDANSEIERLKDQLIMKQDTIAKFQDNETDLKEQLEDFKMQGRERETILMEKKEEVKYLKVEVEKGEEVKKENTILKERLRQLQTEFDISDKKWDVVEMASCDMKDVIQGLIRIQDRLKRVIPTASPGEM